MDSALSWAEHSANLRRKKPTGAALIMLMMQLESQSQLRGMGIWVQNSELRIQDPGSRGLGILGGHSELATFHTRSAWVSGRLWHCICTCRMPHATVFVYHLSAKRDLSIFLLPLPLAFPDSSFRWCLRNVSMPSFLRRSPNDF